MATESSQMQSHEDTSESSPRGAGYLSSYEVKWKDRQPFLKSKGYMLRPRLRPGWTPSWLSSGKSRWSCEDSVRLPVRPLLVDATRISDNKLVYIKEVKTGDLESSIALKLCALNDPTNHSVPILDTFVDYADESISYIVMPFLRLSNNPPFETVGEVVDFADQVLEGLVFMHSRGVAHRDCSLKNILMDATHMFPLGFHPVKNLFLFDFSSPAPIISRRHAGVKYYFIDYGISSYFSPEEPLPHRVVGLAGRDQDVPELSDKIPYDPFKVDIFTVGNVLLQELCHKYSNLHFFRPLIVSMMQRNPDNRPSAEEALLQWRAIRGNLTIVRSYWRLWDRREPLVYSLLLDIIHFLLSIPRLVRSATWRRSNV